MDIKYLRYKLNLNIVICVYVIVYILVWVMMYVLYFLVCCVVIIFVCIFLGCCSIFRLVGKLNIVIMLIEGYLCIWKIGKFIVCR